MDGSHKQYSINNTKDKTIFDRISFESNDKNFRRNSFDEYENNFTIDDDDIILLDESQVLLNEVKTILNQILNKIIQDETDQSQIKHRQRKRSVQLKNGEEYSLNKKVRFNISNSEEEKEQQQQQTSPTTTCLFVSEKFHSENSLKPYSQFLFNLGFDLCLEQTINNNNNDLLLNEKEKLIKYNKEFHQYKISSCKYCSFQTNTIHVMDKHYRTPHTLTNSTSNVRKYRCTYCLFETIRLPELRRHYEKKHGYLLICEPHLRRYLCSFCSYETDERNHFIKHNNRCRIEQTRTANGNNLLSPFNQLKRKTNKTTKKKKSNVKTKQISSENETKHGHIIETLIIESDHDSSICSQSSSDEDFIVSSDDEKSSTSESEDLNDQDFQILNSRSKKSQQFHSKSSSTTISQSSFIYPQTSTNLSSLSKLLLLNGTSVPSLTMSSLPTNKPLVPIQPKPTAGDETYQICNICQCYIYKKNYEKHLNEKHNNQATILTPISILNNTTNNSNPSTTVFVAKATPSTIFLLSTAASNKQSVTLNMIKCPWCDTNFEHIDVMTGHLMKYHRMTLAAAKVVVAEQMKIQNTSSNQLSILFKKEIDQIQQEFSDKTYWKIFQPKVFLHQFENLSCFVCKQIVDNIDEHLISFHEMKLSTMNKIKQCCFCGFRCNKKTLNLFEHQLRTHSGVCYSSVLKQFIRFDPAPAQISRTNPRLILPLKSTISQPLKTHTEKKFGCRKCDTSSRLFTFEELVEHLHSIHQLNVKLHRRCLICQQTFLKGKEFNQHCLEHLHDENPSIEIKRFYQI